MYHDSDNLPEGWCATELRQVVVSKKGAKPKLLTSEPGDGLVPYILIDQMEGIAATQFTNSKDIPIASDSDVLIVWDGSIGKTACGVVGAVGSTIMLLTPILIEPAYLEFFLRLCKPFIEQNSRGSGLQHINPDVFWNIKIPLAPLPEQKRIVAKIEALLHQVNVLEKKLQRIAAILTQFRYVVLAAACSGKLTENWKENHSTVDGANKLINNILSRRRTIIKGNRACHYNQPLNPNEEQIGNIPDGWVAATIDQLTTLVTSGSRGWAKYYAKSGPIFIRAQNISTDRLILNNIAHVHPPNNAEGRRTLVQIGDLLVTITGANITRTALVEVEIGEAYINQHVALIRFVDDTVNRFVHMWMVSPYYGRAKLLKDAYGAGKPGLNLDNIRDTTIALPSLEEQKEIVRRVNALFKLADIIESHFKAARKRVDELTQVILTKAFRGELITIEADLARKEGQDYESGEKLLERIKRDKDLSDIRTKKRRKVKLARVKTGIEDKKISKTLETKNLYSILKSIGKRVTPSELLAISKLTIDDFYEQLEADIRVGRIVEHRPNDIDVFLEVGN